MGRITDMTLSCLEPFSPSKEQIRLLYELLCEAGPDCIEMPVLAYEAIKPAATEKIILRLPAPELADDYPEVRRFVCRNSGLAADPCVTYEHQANGVRELRVLPPDFSGRRIRIVGLDNIFCHDVSLVFADIRERFGEKAELCPEDSLHCATAAAVEWALRGGDVAAAFGGIAGKAATEEVLLALRVIDRRRPGATFEMFPEIAAVVEEVTSVRFGDRKPVIGREIFCVESGIHVDGILKRPRTYEPFPPELVGAKRSFVVGKHSGKRSIAAKLSELGYSPGEFDIPRLLAAVREESVRKMSSLTDEEFREIAVRFRLGGEDRNEGDKTPCRHDDEGRGAEPWDSAYKGAED